MTETITAINTLMDMRKFGGDVADDVQLLIMMQNQYKVLLADCEKYLGHHSATKAGKARKEIVRQISNLAQQDIQGLYLASDQIGKASKTDRAAMTWDDLLQKARSVKIQMSNTFQTADRAQSGAISDVKMLKSDNAQTMDANGQSQALTGLKFFKAREVVNPKESAGSVAIKKVLADNPTLSDEQRATLLRIFYHPGNERFVDPRSREVDLPDSIMRQLMKYHESATVLKEQLLQPSGLNSVGQIEMSGRNVATSRMADLLGVGNLVARSELAEVTDSAGATRKGIIMDAAKGKSFDDILTMSETNGTKGDYAKSGRNLVAPSFLRDISSLQALDIICGQMDRHTSNMFYQSDDSGRLTGVMGIDNDAAFGTNENALSMKGEQRADRAVYDDEDNLVLPHLDRTFAEHVESLSEGTVRFALHDLIGEPETLALLHRLKRLKNAIRHAAPGQLLEKEEDWNDAVQQEMLQANDTSDKVQAAIDKFDINGRMMERYGVANVRALPEEQQPAAQLYREALSAKLRQAFGVEQGHGENYTSMLARI